MQQILHHIERRVRPSLRSYLEAERALTAALQAGNPDTLDAARQSVELAARQAVDMLHHLAEFVQHEWTPPFPDVGPVRIAIDARCEFLRNGKHVADVYLLRDVSVAFKHHYPRTGRIEVSNDIAPGGFGFGQCRWGEGKYGGVEQIVVATNDSDRRALSSILQNVFDAWMFFLRPAVAADQPVLRSSCTRSSQKSARPSD